MTVYFQFLGLRNSPTFPPVSAPSIASVPTRDENALRARDRTVARLSGRQRREPRERLCNVDRRLIHLSERDVSRCDNGERTVALRSGQRKTKLLLHRARQETTHAVLLPVRRLHHFFDTSLLGLTSRVEHALLLGNSPTFRSSLFGGALAVVAADVTWRRDGAFDLTLPFLDAAVLGFGSSRWKGMTYSGSFGSRRRT